MATLLVDTGTVLDQHGFAAMVGCDPDVLPQRVRTLLAGADLRYEAAIGRAFYGHLLGAFSACDKVQPVRSVGEQIPGVLAPAPCRIRPDVVRLRGDYVCVRDVGFEHTLRTALHHYCAGRWFADCRAVAEFGCAAGTNLALLAEALPGMPLRACTDDVATRRSLERWSRRASSPLDVRPFSLRRPDRSLSLAPGTGVLTSAAMQALGGEHEAFVDHLLAVRPKICVHIEPLYELYDPDLLFDDVARQYHRRRSYLRGLLPRLRSLAAEGRIELLEQRRTGLGSFLDEPYGILVWRPR